MSASAAAERSELTPYEAEQVRRIAAWKSKPPNPLSELWKRLTLPAADFIERLIPDSLISAAIEKAYKASDLLAGQEEIKRRAGVRDLEELKKKPLEVCDALAERVELSSQVLATLEGAATGAGGMITTVIDIPLLLVLSLGTIRKIGHCYGYPLDHRKGLRFSLGVLIAALSGSLEVRRQRINQLRELEDLLIEEMQEDLVTEELLSFLFQLEVFEEFPGVGTLSGAVLNWAFIKRVDETARMIFQEKWLRDSGKVREIAPAPAHARHLATGWAGAVGRLAYAGSYGLGFGVALPVYAVASLFRPMDNALTRGLHDGAAAARESVDHLAAGWTSGAPAASADGQQGTPALAPA